MREKRRLALIRRQALMARVARQQALRALAEALESEERSQMLAGRSRMLVAASAPQPGAMLAEAFAARAGFAASLAQLAATAADAASDAARQTEWQAETLSRAETRAKRLAEREDAARAALETAQERREQAHAAAALARKLHTRN
jgi:hypothetical protein